MDGKGVVLRGEDLREATRQRAEASEAQAAEAVEQGRKAPRQADGDGRGGVHHRASGAAAGGGDAGPGSAATAGGREATAAPAQTAVGELGEASRRGHRASPRRSSLAGSHGAQELGGAGRRPPESAQDAAPLFAPIGRWCADDRAGLHPRERVRVEGRHGSARGSPPQAGGLGERAPPEHSAWAAVAMWRVESVAVRPRRGLEGKAREAVDRCANYLLKNAGYLKYDTYLAKGFPIATGVIEGACRYLVKDRMEVTGARWSLAGAEAVLRLRALQASGDFDAYWHLPRAAGVAEKPCRALRGGQGGPSPRPQAPSPEAGQVRRSQQSNRSVFRVRLFCPTQLPNPRMPSLLP